MSKKFPFFQVVVNASAAGRPILPFVTGYVGARVDFAPAQGDAMWQELSMYLRMLRRDSLTEARAVIDAVAGKNADMIFLAYLSDRHYKKWLFAVDACIMNNFKNHADFSDIAQNPNRDIIAHTRAAEMFEFIRLDMEQPSGYRMEDQNSQMVERAFNVLNDHAPEARVTFARLVKLSDIEVNPVVAQNFWLYSTGIAL